MPNKKTRLKLKDNVRKGLIAFMSMALLFTTIQFTNVRAEEGQTDPTPVTENADVEQGQEYELDFVVESEIGLFAKWLEVTLNGEVVEFDEDGEGNITSKVTVSEDDLTDGTAELKVDVERYLVEEGEEDVPPYKYYKIDEVKVDDTSLEGDEGVYSVPVDGNKTVTITLGTDMRFQETEEPEETEEPVETEEPEVPAEEAAVYGPNDRTVELGQTIDITGKTGSGHKWSSDKEDVASVNSAATQTMTVRAKNIGTAVITHTYRDKDKTQKETFNVTVTMPSTFDIEIEVGEEKKFTTEQTYESSNTKVAQMKPLAGTVIGVSEGVTTLTQPTYGTKLYTVKVVQPTPIVPVVTADKIKDLVAGDVVTFDIVLENTNAKELKDVVVDVTKPLGAKFVDDSSIQKTVDVPAGGKVTLKAQFSVTAADVAAGKDIEFGVEVTSAGVKKNATAVVKPFDAANAFDVSKAIAEGSTDHDLKEGQTVYFYVYVRNNSSTVLTDVVVEELLTGAEIVDDGTGLYVIESGKARIEYIGSGEIVPVKAKYVMTAADVTAKKAISNTAKATYAGVSKESNAVSFRPASVSTVNVYVYMKVGGFSKEALAALGIPDGLVTNGSGYAPVGVLKVDESFFIGQGYPTNWASSMTAMLRNSADWDRLFNSVVSLETKGMVDYSGRQYSKNNGNKVTVEQVKLARRDTGATAGTTKTAMFTQTGSDKTKEYGQGDKNCLHLDCVFDTVSVSFVDENGQPYKEGGKVVDDVYYITGQHMSNPGFAAEEGYVIEYYMNGSTSQWNFATDTVTQDSTMTVVKKQKQGVTTVTKSVLNPKKDDKGNVVPFGVGDTVQFSITVQNDGNYTFENIEVEDQLAGATIVAGGGYKVVGGKAVIDKLYPSKQVTIRATYTTQAADSGKTVTNTAVAMPKGGPKGEGKATFEVASTLTATVKSATFEYDGQPHNATVEVTGLPAGYTATATSAETVTKVAEGQKVANVTTVVVKDGSGTEVTNRFTINKVPGTIQVTAKALTVNKTDTREYNGTEQSLDFSEADVASQIVAGDDVKFSASIKGTEINTYTTVTPNPVVPTGKDADNYTVTVTGSLTITKNTSQVTVTINGNTKTETYTGTQKSVEGYDYTVSAGSKTDFTVALAAGAKAEAKGKDAGTYYMNLTTASFTVTSDKYSNIKVVVNDGWLQINQSTTPVTVNITGKYDTKEYTGSKQTVEGYDYTVSGAAKDQVSVALKTGKEAKAEGTDVNTYMMGLKKEDFTVTSRNYSNITVNYTDGYLTITPYTGEVTVTITGANGSKPYNGSEQNVTGFSTDVGTKTINVALKSGYEAKAVGTDAGHYVMGLKEEYFDVTSANYSNIKVSVVDGYLDITPFTGKVTVVITGNTDSVVYNGAEQYVEGFTTDVGIKKINVSLKPGKEAKAVGTDAGHYVMGLKEEDFNVTSSNYSNIVLFIKDGYLDITKSTDAVTVNIIGNHDSKPYTGKEQEVTGYEYTVTGANKDQVTVSLKAGKQAVAKGTDAAHYTMGLKKGDFNVTSKNYSNITYNYVDGYLDITKSTDPVTVTITGKHDTKEYTGSKQSVEGYEYTVNGANKDQINVALKTGKEAKAEGIDADTYYMQLTEADFDVTSRNYSNITYSYTDGYLVITKNTSAVAVTIKGNTATVPYNGSLQNVTGYDYTVNGANKDQIVVTLDPAKEAKAEGTDVGTYYMGLTKNDFTATSNNYSNIMVSYTDGYLTITPNTGTVTVTITGNHDTKEYNGSMQNVTGYTYSVTGASKDEVVVTLDPAKEAKAEGKDAGTYYMGLVKADFTVTSSNYSNITYSYTDGYLTITPCTNPVTVIIDGNHATKPYNGSLQDVTGYVYAVTGAEKDQITVSLLNGKVAKAEGTNANTYYMGLTKNDFSVTSRNYSNISHFYTDGYLTITPITGKVTVTVTENDATYPYDKQWHQIYGYSTMVSDNTLYDVTTSVAETPTANWTVRQINSGVYPMGIQPADFANTNTNFTTVEFVIVDGELEITPDATPITVTVIESSLAVDYDGQKHMIQGYDRLVSSNENLYEASSANIGHKATADWVVEATDAGTYPLGLMAEDFYNKNPNFTNVFFTIEDRNLLIRPVKDKVTVTVTENSDSVTYDGTLHSIYGYTDIKADHKLFDIAKEVAETPKAAWTAKGTDAGTYPVGIQSADFSLKTNNFSNVVFDIKDGSLVIGPKSIVDDPDHFQVGNVEDKVYNGKEQFVEPDVTDLDVQGLARAAGTQLVNGTDYTLSYNNTLDYKNVTGNPVTVTVTGKGNYTGQLTRSYKILTAPLDVMTPSATKVYDGSPLTATAGTLTGLVNGETATFTTTGSQTAVGSSQNSYTLTWDGTAKKTNYTVAENLGTLTVTGVTPGPTPTPPGPPIIPTPTPVPPAPPVVPPAPPVQPVVVPDDNTPGAPVVEVERLDSELIERGEYGLRGSYCVLHIFILLLAAVVEAFLLVKVKKDNKELEDELAELEESGANV